MMDPPYLPIDDLEPAAGEVVLLIEVLGQHTAAEIRIAPGDILSLNPGGRWDSSVNYVV
jgi:hypothetical protein